MITADDLRRFATAFPDVEEFTHHIHKQPGFRVRGKAFAGLEKGGSTAVFSVAEAEAQAAITAEPDLYEGVWRPNGTWVGVRVDLTAVPDERVRELLDHAWRNRAPKRLVAAYDAG